MPSRDDTERRERPLFLLLFACTLVLLGGVCMWNFYGEVGRKIRPPVSLNDGHDHLGEVVYVTDIRFDCAQTFFFDSPDKRSVRTCVVASSEDGSVAAVARVNGTFNCVSAPASPVRGRLHLLYGNTDLARMRRQGVQIPQTSGPTLGFEMELDPPSEWLTLLFGVVCLLIGTRAFLSALKRRGTLRSP